MEVRPVVGLLSPGQMGSSVGAAARASGARVLVALEERSAASRRRAADDGLEDVGSLEALCQSASAVISVCPPDCAQQVAEAVFSSGFSGLFIDANAIAPDRVRSFAGRARAAGIALVDGGLIGPPARSPGSTRLYLSGSEAESAAALFAASPLEALPIGGEVGAASALKMAYAAYTKGLAALLLGAHSCAREHGVESALLAEWERSQPGLVQRLEAAAAHVAPRAWRFAGEMDEIARSFAAVGLPAGFHEAAADLYRRMAEFKDAEQSPTVDEVAAALESGAPPWRR